MKAKVVLFIVIEVLAIYSFAQKRQVTAPDMQDKIPVLYLTDSSTFIKNDTITNTKAFSFVPFPAVSFDSDLGFQYGLIGSFNYYGNRQFMPDYLWSVYAEWSRYTKGSGTNQLYFDSKYLLPFNLRMTAEVDFLTEQALNFYGFNGFGAAYIPSFEDQNSVNYISRMFYRHERKLLIIALDFQRKLISEKWRLLAGFGHFNNKLGTVDIQTINEGLDEEDQLPDTTTLYDKYIEWGLIGTDEADGGILNTIKLGLIYDSRDNESDPSRGTWAEVLLFTAPSFMANSESAYSKLAVVMRQYIPLLDQKLIFAYRIGWQGTIDGRTPFYMQPYMISTNLKVTQHDGLGGGKSMRGVLRNRIVGDAIAYSNLELRYRFAHLNIFNTNFYFTLSGFGDFGMVTKAIELDKSQIPSTEFLPYYFDQEYDNLHSSFGLGGHLDIERNLILAVDYGISANRKDGKSGLYIGVGFLF